MIATALGRTAVGIALLLLVGVGGCVDVYAVQACAKACGSAGMQSLSLVGGCVCNGPVSK